MEQGEPASTRIGWIRAVATAAAAVAVAVLGLAVGPDLVLDRVDALDRSVKVALVTTWFFVALLVLAWGLRRLQSRGLI